MHSNWLKRSFDTKQRNQSASFQHNSYSTLKFVYDIGSGFVLFWQKRLGKSQKVFLLLRKTLLTHVWDFILNFLKNVPVPTSFFVYFCSFLVTISIIQIERSIDGVLRIRTRGPLDGGRRWNRGAMAATCWTHQFSF